MFKGLALMCVLGCMAAGQALASGEAVAWLAFGDLRGYVEPCGCDPQTDKGGIQRLYQAVQQERLARPGLWVFSLGNYPDPLHPDPAKDRAFEEFSELLRPTATLFNLLEAKSANAGRMSFVLSNAAGALPSGAATVIESEGLVVFGFVSPSQKAHGYFRPLSKALLESWGERLTSKRKAYKVLLFSGDLTDLKVLTESGLFDEIILSNRSAFDVQPDAREFNEPARLRVDAAGKSFLQVPLGGQGVLRGGLLARERASSLDQLLGVAKECKGGRGSSDGNRADCGGGLSSGLGAGQGWGGLIDWLGKEWQDKGAEITPLKNYKVAKGGQYEAFVKKKLAARPGVSGYVGSEACMGCHQAEYRKWKESGHADAFATLVGKKAERNGDCVTCHVIGFDRADGFIDESNTGHLKNVGCEQCHGPRLKHLSDPKGNRAPVADAPALCAGCHHPPHTAAFSFKEYWERIKH